MLSSDYGRLAGFMADVKARLGKPPSMPSPFITSICPPAREVAKPKPIKIARSKTHLI
jgi:hypothetical protein